MKHDLTSDFLVFLRTVSKIHGQYRFRDCSSAPGFDDWLLLQTEIDHRLKVMAHWVSSSKPIVPTEGKKLLFYSRFPLVKPFLMKY